MIALFIRRVSCGQEAAEPGHCVSGMYIPGKGSSSCPDSDLSAICDCGALQFGNGYVIRLYSYLALRC